MKDLWIEIWESIKRNKLRTSLTGFAVAWGIFMLIVLLGAGNGLLNAFLQSGSDFASNTMQIYGGQTTKPYDGLNMGRWIKLEDKDISLSQSKQFSDIIDEVTALGENRNNIISYKKNHCSNNIVGCYPKYRELSRIDMICGRFLNFLDLEQTRKSVTINERTARKLLNGNKNVEQLLGKYISINNISFLVVGISKTNEGEQDSECYIPFSTFQMVYNATNRVDLICFTFHGLPTEEANNEFEKQYRSVINKSHRADPTDEGAIWIWNRFTQDLQMNKATDIIHKALWVIGFLTLIGGIVGVSNIMLITVKERTYEFGIRKALGAAPWDIMKLIISESITITGITGYIGMVLGMLCCEIMNLTIGQSSINMMGQNIKVFENPTVGVDVALGVTILLILAGTMAGLSPAIKAARIKPTEALQSR